jgi:hypothetical protein
MLLCLQLRSISKIPHTVSGFLLGKILGSWLHLEEDSSRHFLGTRTWVVDKSQRRYIRVSLPEDIKKLIYEQQWGGGSLIASPLGEGEGGEAATKAGVQTGVETILIANCRDQEGHGDGYPLRKRWSMTLPMMAGTTMVGITLIIITNLFVVCTAKLAMKPVGIQFSSRTAPPPLILVLIPSWAGGPYPIMSGRGIKSPVYHQQ